MSTDPVKLEAHEWEALIGHAAFFKMASACECGASWDFAEYAAAKALNTAVNIGLMPMPQEKPIIAECGECGPLRFLDENGNCERCLQPVELVK